MRYHSTCSRKADAYILEAKQIIDNEVDRLVGQTGIAYSGAYALKLFGMKLSHSEVLILGIPPVVLTHLLVHFLGCSLGKTVGKERADEW